MKRLLSSFFSAIAICCLTLCCYASPPPASKVLPPNGVNVTPVTDNCLFASNIVSAQAPLVIPLRQQPAFSFAYAIDDRLTAPMLQQSQNSETTQPAMTQPVSAPDHPQSAVPGYAHALSKEVVQKE